MARRTQTYAVRLAVEGGGWAKAELVSVGQSGEQSLKRIETVGERASRGLILADISRIAVRQAITDPAAGLLESSFSGGDLFGLFHEGGVVGGRPAAVRYAEPAAFADAPRFHGGGFAGGGLLPNEVPIIARRGELVVPPERIVREQTDEAAPITVVINVTAADANRSARARGRSQRRWRVLLNERGGTVIILSVRGALQMC